MYVILFWKKECSFMWNNYIKSYVMWTKFNNDVSDIPLYGIINSQWINVYISVVHVSKNYLNNK